jgi:hypothetical protein
LLPLLLLAAWAVPSRGGTVVTRDGRTVDGEVTLSADGVAVKPKQGAAAAAFKFAEVARVDFGATAAGPGATDDAGATPKAEHSAEAAGRIFVEYFADPDMKDRRLARYEKTFMHAWSMASPPDPFIPQRPVLRMTARYVPSATRDHRIGVQCYGPFRLFVDDQLKFDHWAGGKLAGDHATVSVPMEANKAVTIRLEAGGGQSLYLCNMNVTPTGGASRALADALAPMPESPAPVVTAKLAGDSAYFRAPPAIGVDVAVAPMPPGMKVVRVDLVADGLLLASETSAAKRVEWKNPPPGVYRLRAQVTDDRGVSGYSEPIDVSVAGVGGVGGPVAKAAAAQSLPEPWGSLTIGKRESATPGTVSYEGGTFRLTKAGGQVTENDDTGEFVYQPVKGDFEIVAHVASLTPADLLVGPLAGIMVRDNMTGSTDRYLAVVVGPNSTTVARRADTWGKAEAAARQDAVAAWLKVERVDNRVRAFTSADGREWSLLGNDKLTLPPRAYVGLCAMARSKETPAVAAFDHVKLTPGSPPLTHRVEGILFKNGSFLACEVRGVKAGKVALDRNGQRQYIPDSDVARIVYKAVTAEVAQNAPADQTGVLMASGDFLDGEIKDITSYSAVVSNVVFGRRTVVLKGQDVVAINLAAATPPAEAIVITAVDGSVYQAKTIAVSGDRVSFEDPAVGAVELSRKDLAQLRTN